MTTQESETEISEIPLSKELYIPTKFYNVQFDISIFNSQVLVSVEIIIFLTQQWILSLQFGRSCYRSNLRLQVTCII